MFAQNVCFFNEKQRRKHLFKKASLKKSIQKKKTTELKLLNSSLYMHFNTSLYLIYLQLYLGKDCCFDLF